MSVDRTGPASQPEQRQAFMQALTTEHFTLQTARAVAVNEGNGRTALYVGALSSILVAGITVLAGMASGTTVLAVNLAYQARRFASMKTSVAAEFPSARSRPTLVPPTSSPR